MPKPIAELHVGRTDVIDMLADEWRELCEQAPVAHPFCRPEWIRAYVRAFAPGTRVALITVRSSGRLVAVLPMVDERGHWAGLPIRRLRAATNWHLCRFDLVRAADAEGDRAVPAIWELLRELEWDVLELPDVPQGGAIERVADAALAAGFRVGRWASVRSPFVTIAQAGDRRAAPVTVRSGFRSNLRRKLRNLAAQGDVRLTRVSEAQSGALERFYQLERSGWKGREGTAIACSPVTRQFYDEIAVEAERFGYLTLYFLELNGRAIAGQFGVTYGGRYFMPKLAHDEQFDQYSPGHLLVDAILQDCAERGVTEYDYLGPDHEWKLRWTNTVRPHTSFFVYRNAAYARALWAARFRVLPAIKRLMGKRHAA